jgi:hypothetical protein
MHLFTLNPKYFCTLYSKYSFICVSNAQYVLYLLTLKLYWAHKHIKVDVSMNDEF